MHRVDGELQLGQVKTDGSVREVPVPKSLLPILLAHRQAQEAERAGHLAQLAGPAKKSERAAVEAWDKGHMFTTTLGTPIEPRNVNRHFDTLWRQVRRTAKVIYVDVAEELQRGAVDKLAFLFEEPVR
ncbi:hypothetical protein [Kribbella sp. NPDC050459]|uniref:hypothetical protein n=1 Tax=Kribbella sp. NPDC050459 TaxID=3155785 RepID=UPI0034047828